MKKQITTLIAILLAQLLYSQTTEINYVYDNAGNRIERHVIVIPMGKSEDGDSKKGTEVKPKMDKLQEHDISIFPNPTHGLLMIEINHLDKVEKSSIEVFSLQGKRILYEDNIKTQTQVDLSDYPAETYILKINLGDEQSVWKIVRE